MRATSTSVFSGRGTLDGVLRRVKAGDRGETDPVLRARIDAAFGKHEPRLRAFVTRELRRFSAEQVEDTVQQVLAIAWTKLAEHDGTSFRAWLFGIARNECANVRRKCTEILLDEDALFEVPSPAASAYRELQRAERERVLLDAAARVLDPLDQEIFYLRHVDDVPRDEIARLLGLAGAEEVRVALQRGKRRLADELERTLAELRHSRSLFTSESGER